MIRVHVLFKILLIFAIIVVINILYNQHNMKKLIPQVAKIFYEDTMPHQNISIVDQEASEYNIWLIFTKVIDKSPLMYNFNRLINNLMNVSSLPLNFHVIIDNGSKPLAEAVFSEFKENWRLLSVNYYHIEHCASKISDIIQAMMPHFSSKPGTYYSDALFYVSLGLFRFAPESQKQAVLLDCDLYFKEDIALLFQQFKSFTNETLLALSPELSPVYHHILHKYTQRHKNSTFGQWYQPQLKPHLPYHHLIPHHRGFQGYNSGVILFNLTAIRASAVYPRLIRAKSVANMTARYYFRGHLGDQDFYTLLGWEWPQLVKTMHCGMNRQLCTWWKYHGYADVFERYFRCEHDVVVLHGNCNTNVLKYVRQN